MQAFLKMHRYFKKDMWMRHKLPFFVIDMNTPKWSTMTYEFVRSSFISGDTFLSNLESLHFTSDSDQFRMSVDNWVNYEAPVFISHDQGHRPVKTLPEKKLKEMADFFIRQYRKKNNAETDELKENIRSFYKSLDTCSMLPR